MILIKDTIARVGKALLNAQAISKAHPYLLAPKTSDNNFDRLNSSAAKPDSSLAKRPEHQNRLSTPNRCKTAHRAFLRPLHIPSLKTFDDEPAPYDVLTATENWKYKAQSRHGRRSSMSSARSVSAAIQRRNATMNFERMVKTLFRMAPESVKASTPFETKQVLERHTQELTRYRYPVIRHRFDGIPQMPDPPTRHTFEEYIYTLTHLAFHGNPKSSQVISDTLLKTHGLPGDKWKELRLEVTYNYLIKYFGYDKHQSAFARQLLLVMNEDGRRINTDTINHLIKVCRTHSHIRSMVDTSVLVMKCLKLAQDFGVEINLSTFTHVFDTISDASLRTSFLKKLNMHKIPLLRGMQYRILDDISNECESSSEFISQMELVISPADWKQDPVLWNKLVKHKARIETNRDMRGICVFACKNHADLSAHTVTSLVGGTCLRKSINKWKEFYMISRYFHILDLRDLDMSQAPGVYALLVSRALASELSGVAKNYLIRGILHEASIRLKLSRRKKQNYIALSSLLAGHVARQIKSLETQNRCPILQEFHGSELEGWETLKQDLLHPVIDENDMSEIVRRFIGTSEEKVKEKGIKRSAESRETCVVSHS